ncbi:DNA-directed RNA polymerase II subunit RPB1 [Sergentomyia squamirostris]
MNKFCAIGVLALAAVAFAEPPSSYQRRPSSSYGVPSLPSSSYGAPALSFSSGSFGHGGSFGHSGGLGHSGGFGHSSGFGHSGGGSFGYSGGHGGGLHSGFGGGYRAVSHGYQSNEGQHVDSQLLHKVKQILLDQENQAESYHGSHHGGALFTPSSSYGVPSHSYGAPSPVYGVPHHHSRVVGIDLGHVRQGIQVAQYHQESIGHHDSGYSYPSAHSGHSGHGGYSLPSSSYGAPTAYVAPPSSSYGVPHH